MGTAPDSTTLIVWHLMGLLPNSHHTCYVLCCVFYVACILFAHVSKLRLSTDINKRK